MLVVLHNIHTDVMMVVVKLMFQIVHFYLDVLIQTILIDVKVEDVLLIQLFVHKITHNLLAALPEPHVAMMDIVELYVLFMMDVLNLKHHLCVQLEDVLLRFLNVLVIVIVHQINHSNVLTWNVFRKLLYVKDHIDLILVRIFILLIQLLKPK
jgi:hypothetical protein